MNTPCGFTGWYALQVDHTDFLEFPWQPDSNDKTPGGVRGAGFYIFKL